MLVCCKIRVPFPILARDPLPDTSAITPSIVSAAPDATSNVPSTPFAIRKPALSAAPAYRPSVTLPELNRRVELPRKLNLSG